MNNLQSGILLLVLVLAIFGLPFLPAILALRRPAKLKPVPTSAHDASMQCEEFRKLIETSFSSLVSLARKNGTIRGTNAYDQPYIVLGFQSHLAQYLPANSRRLRSCVVASGHLDVPGEMICDRELFAEGRINLGHHALARSMLALRDVAIGPRARVLRWVRSDRRLDVAEGANIKGWASAGLEITFARRARFRKAIAPEIRFGRQREAQDARNTADTVASFSPPARSGDQPGNGHDLAIPALHTMKGDLVLSGVLKVGDGCHLIGRIRADKGVILGQDVRVDGAIHSGGEILIGARCCISGPIVSIASIEADTGCLFGSKEAPCTVSAEIILIGEGCVAYGTVQALRHGEVIAERTSA